MSELTDLIRTLPNYDPCISAGESRFDEGLAQKAIDFIQRFLTLSKDSAKSSMGSPFVLQPWQKAIIANLFGWLRTDGSRRYREALLLLPRKQGKSELLAAIVNYVGFCDGEKGGEIYSAAADRNQASLVFSSAKTMIANNAKLTKRAKVYQHSIIYPNNTTYKSLSSESYSKHGLNASLICIDELHAIQDRDLIDVLTTSIGARRQPLIVYITTADFARPGIYAEIYKRAKQCQAATKPADVGYDPYFLPVIYEATHEDDWKSPVTWTKCNPNLGVSIQLDYLQTECRKATDTPSYENTFKRLHLNLSTEADVRWLSSKDWDACKGLPFDVKTLDGKECIAAMDLASTADLACVLLYFPESKVLLPHYFAPKDNAEKRERLDKVPYLTWERQGHITLTPGNVIDYDFIKSKIIALSQQYRIKELAYDPWSATQLALQLQSEGLSMVEFRQGFISLSEPSKEFERLTKKGEIRHLHNPILSWNAANVCIVTDPAGNIKPSKAKSTERIDGIVCAVMAIGRSMLATTFKSVYSTRDVLFV